MRHETDFKGEPLRNLAKHILRSRMRFDMGDSTTCATAHARVLGYMPVKKHAPKDHPQTCGCTMCCSFKKGAQNLGISHADLETIFCGDAIGMGASRATAARKLRQMAKELDHA